MKTPMYFLAVLLLLFNGLGAVYGGLMLILAPNGELMHITVDYLKYSPFSTFLIPGIVLFVFNGLSSLCIAGIVLFKKTYSARLILFQGIILTGWIGIQVILLKLFNSLHLVMGLTGLLMMISGTFLQKAKYFDS